MSDDAGARLQIEKAPQKAELKAAPNSERSTVAVRPMANDANLDIPPYLDPRSISVLQRYAGNAAVARLLRPRTSGGPMPLQRAAPPQVAAAPARAAAPAPTHAPKRPAAAAALPPNAGRLIADQFPHLVSVLTPTQVGQVQRVLTARWRLAQIDAEMAQTENFTEEGVAAYQRLKAKRDAVADLISPQYTTYSVPTKKLLGDDILLSQEAQQDKPQPNDLFPDATKRGQERAIDFELTYRDTLYTQLLSYPVNLVMPEADPEHPARTPLFKFLWGPNQWEMEQTGGLIEWHDLMRVRIFAETYGFALLGEIAKAQLGIVGLQEEAYKLGKILYPSPLGKKLGERTGTLGRTGPVMVGQELTEPGGVPDDEAGRLQLAGVMAVEGAKVIFEDQGFLHAFLLDPADALKSKRDLVTYAHDGYGYIIDTGTEVSAWNVKNVFTTDGVELVRMKSTNPQASGWGTPLAAGAQDRIEQFFIGGFAGDFVEDQTGANVMGQLLFSMIPVVGEAFVLRDVVAGIHKIYVTGGKEGKFQTALNLVILFLPVIGPPIGRAIKGFFKGGEKAVAKGAEKAAARAAARALEKDTPRLSKQMAELLEKELPRAEKLFPDAAKLGREASEALSKAVTEGRPLMGRALKGDTAAAEGFAQQVRKALDASSGDVRGVVERFGGKWAEIIEALKPAKDGELVGQQLFEWRKANVKGFLEESFSRDAEAMSAAVGRPVRPPELVPTGTLKWTSDLDMSIKGPYAGAQKLRAEKLLADRFGAKWGDLFNMSIFTDASRLHAFTEAGLTPAKLAEVEAKLVRPSEINVLAKMLHEGSSVDQVLKYAESMHPVLTKVANPQATPFWKAVLEQRAVIEKLAGSEGARRGLQLEIDALELQLERAANMADRARISEEIATRQMTLNALEKDAYATPGSGYREVTHREAGGNLEARRSGQVSPTLSPAMRYQAFLGELPMVDRTLRDIAEAAEQGLTPKTAKALAKYGDRMVIVAGQLGATDAAKIGGKAADVASLFHNVEFLLTAKGDPVTMLEKGRPVVEKALEQMKSLLGDMIQSSKRAEFRAPRVGAEEEHAIEETLTEWLHTIVHIGGKLLEPKEGEKATEPAPRGAKSPQL
jgi:hypothetical protein